MKISKIRKYNGKWFVPYSSVEISGVLIVNIQDSFQELKIYSSFDFNGIEIQSENYIPQNYKTVCGSCDLSNNFTLTDCKFKSYTYFIDNLYEIVYEPVFSYSGGVFYSHENILATQLTCMYPYLSAWYDTNQLFFGSHFQTIEENQLKRTISTENLKTTIKINSSFSIEIERYYEQNDMPFSREVSIEIKHYVNFKSAEPIPLSELKKKAYSFMQLMMLSIGKQMYINFTSVIVETSELEVLDKPIRNRLNINYFHNYRKRNIVKYEEVDRQYMLFYGGERNKEQLNKIIINWYNSYIEFSTIYGIYLETFEWFKGTDIVLTEIMFKNRFLNLIQALESYHSLIDSKHKNEDKDEIKNKVEILIDHLNARDKEWIIERISPKYVTLGIRLKDLIFCKLSNITSEFFYTRKEKESFIYHVTEIRNGISHGRNVTFDSNKISDYYNKALMLLLCCILKNLNFTNDEIKTMILKTTSYANRIIYIKRLNSQKLQNL